MGWDQLSLCLTWAWLSCASPRGISGSLRATTNKVRVIAVSSTDASDVLVLEALGAEDSEALGHDLPNLRKRLVLQHVDALAGRGVPELLQLVLYRGTSRVSRVVGPAVNLWEGGRQHRSCAAEWAWHPADRLADRLRIILTT